MSRKVKFSRNRRKAKARRQRMHARVRHSAATSGTRSRAPSAKTTPCIEDLQVRNMSKSAAGTAAQPGRNVRAKSRLNKSIIEQGWFEFRRQRAYKLAWRGGWPVAAPPQNRRAAAEHELDLSGCGCMSVDNRPTQARLCQVWLRGKRRCGRAITYQGRVCPMRL